MKLAPRRRGRAISLAGLSGVIEHVRQFAGVIPPPLAPPAKASRSTVLQVTVTPRGGRPVPGVPHTDHVAMRASCALGAAWRWLFRAEQHPQDGCERE